MKPTTQKPNNFISRSLPRFAQIASLAFVVCGILEPDHILSALDFIAAGVWQIVANQERNQ